MKRCLCWFIADASNGFIKYFTNAHKYRKDLHHTILSLLINHSHKYTNPVPVFLSVHLSTGLSSFKLDQSHFNNTNRHSHTHTHRHTYRLPSYILCLLQYTDKASPCLSLHVSLIFFVSCFLSLLSSLFSFFSSNTLVLPRSHISFRISSLPSSPPLSLSSPSLTHDLYSPVCSVFYLCLNTWTTTIMNFLCICCFHFTLKSLFGNSFISFFKPIKTLFEGPAFCI